MNSSRARGSSLAGLRFCLSIFHPVTLSSSIYLRRACNTTFSASLRCWTIRGFYQCLTIITLGILPPVHGASDGGTGESGRFGVQCGQCLDGHPVRVMCGGGKLLGTTSDIFEDVPARKGCTVCS